MKKRIQIPFQQVALSILLSVGTANISFGQQNHPIQLQRTVVNPQTVPVKKKVKQPNNKAGTGIWGAGAFTGAADGEFQNAFSIGSISATQWSTISINQSGGAVTPGTAYWVRSLTGLSQGAYAGGMVALNSNSRANGVALFDSDFYDNGGVQGAFGAGTSPTAHKGELISPSFSLQGYTDSAIALNFFCKWRNFNVSELSAAISIDGGTTWTSKSILTALPAANGVTAEDAVAMVFPTLTTGVTNLSNCKIKFTFDGDYYYAMVDDVSINVAEAYDLTIATADPTGTTTADKYQSVQMTDNASIPVDQLTGQGFRFGANVKNLGYEDVLAVHNASLKVTIQRDVSGSWTTVHQQTTVIDTIDPSGNGTVVRDSLNNTAWATVGSYRAIYNAIFPNSIYGTDADPSNDSLIQNFEINAGNYWSKVGVNTSAEPIYDRAIFPGGSSFNRFEFGSVFSTNAGLDLDSLSYQYFAINTYNGTGSQVVRAYVYEWNDSAVGGTADRVLNADRNNPEFTIVGRGVDSLSGLTASGSYANSVMNMVDTAGNKLILAPNSHYLVSLALEGSAFTATSSIWLGASTAKNYALNNAYSSGLYKTVTNLFLEDGSGSTSGNWVGFGLDIVPSFGLHTTANPCISFSTSASIDSTVSCNGGLNGGISASVTGGLGALTYFWSNAATTASITGLAAGTYTVTVTDTSGCTATSSSTITEPTAVVSAAVLDFGVTCFGGSNGGATASATGGTGSYTYNWSDGSSNKNLRNVVAGTYTVTVSDANGCSDNALVTISQPSAPIQVTIDNNNISCNGNIDGNMKITSIVGAAGTTTYLWSNGATADSIGGLAAGTYTLTLTDAGGCVATATSSITEPALLMNAIGMVNVSCNGVADGSLSANTSGGTMPYGYLWSNGASTDSAAALAAGTYTVTITDANGCTFIGTSSVTEPTALTSSISSSTDVSCNGGTDGSATITASGATAPYAYLWSNAATTATSTGLAAGTYTVTTTDANGCTATSSSTITEPTAITSSTTSTNVSCNGGADGTATASSAGGTGAYTYLWSNGSTTAGITGLTAATYTVTSTDANGCTATSSSTITEPTAVTSNISSTDISCNGSTDGIATVTITGGTGAYTYLWSNGATTATANGLAAGTYTATSTDANGCAATSSATITAPSILATSISTVVNVSCNGGANGTIGTATIGGTAPYTYLWSNGATTATANGLTAGTYTVTTTDSNGCITADTALIAEPAAIDTVVTRNNFTLSANQVGASYQWLDCNNNNSPITGDTLQSYTVSSNGSYAVEVTLNGCVDTSACVMILNVGINEQSSESFSLKLYPNPNKGLFTIQLNEAVIGEILQIINLSGSLISTIDVVSAQQLINLSDLSNGVYFVRYQNSVTKFVLSK